MQLEESRRVPAVLHLVMYYLFSLSFKGYESVSLEASLLSSSSMHLPFLLLPNLTDDLLLVTIGKSQNAIDFLKIFGAASQAGRRNLPS